MGANAIHAAGPVLGGWPRYQPRRPVIDGLEYREGLNAVGIEGGVAGNVIPDLCTVTVNYRYAPDRSEEEALDHVREVFAGLRRGVRVEDRSRARCPASPIRRPAPSLRRSAASRCPSTAGPMSPGSAPWASPPSTTVPGIPTSPTSGMRGWTTALITRVRGAAAALAYRLIRAGRPRPGPPCGD